MERATNVDKSLIAANLDNSFNIFKAAHRVWLIKEIRLNLLSRRICHSNPI